MSLVNPRLQPVSADPLAERTRRPNQINQGVRPRLDAANLAAGTPRTAADGPPRYTGPHAHEMEVVAKARRRQRRMLREVLAGREKGVS